MNVKEVIGEIEKLEPRPQTELIVSLLAAYLGRAQEHDTFGEALAGLMQWQGIIVLGARVVDGRLHFMLRNAIAQDVPPKLIATFDAALTYLEAHITEATGEQPIVIDGAT